MGERKETSITITVPAGGSGEQEITVDPAGVPLTLRETTIFFPTGTEGKLRVRLKYGNMPIVPETGWVTGDASKFISGKTWQFDAGTPLKVEYVNDDTTNEKVAYVAIVYEVKE